MKGAKMVAALSLNESDAGALYLAASADGPDAVADGAVGAEAAVRAVLEGALSVLLVPLRFMVIGQ